MLSAMIFFMIIGAEIFGYFLSVSRISFSLVELVQSLELGPYAVLFCILGLYLLLGCVMDSIAMLLLTVPVVYPLVETAGFDPVWFGIITVIAVEMGLITPPVGMNVFVISAMAEDTPKIETFKGVAPFFGAELLRVLLLLAFPAITLWLPEVLSG
jgi:TRAP-type C4-dicarboxylate transport system permease large subunit